MKKLMSFGRRNIIPIAAFLLVTFLLSACKKDINTGIQNPAAGLMAFNLAPDQDAVGIALANNNFTNGPLSFTTYTGGYNGVYVGNRNVTSYNYSSGADLATTNQLFEDSSYYSLFLVGANGKYNNVIVKDNLDSLPSGTGQAFVRYINAIPDSARQPLVTISSNGTDVFNNNAPFATVSNFKGITPGSISVKASSDTAINVSRDITVEDGKIYTILIMGLPQATDTAKALQIKFIQNGAVSATP